MRSGIVFRTNRKARLDRIQGINIVRPFVPRLFGAARLEISVAGRTPMCSSPTSSRPRADELRRDILLPRLRARSRVAAGVEPAAASAGRGRRTAASRRRAAATTELLAPELDPVPRRRSRSCTMPPGRLHRLDSC